MYAVIYLAGLIFAAGMAWAKFRRMARDLNGVGRKLSEEMKARQAEREEMRLRIIQIAPEAKRDELIAQFLRRD